MKNRRIRSLEKELKRLISRIMRREIDDQGIKLLSVTDVDLTPDISMATVFVSYIKDDEEKVGEIVKRLRRNEKTIRAALTKRLDTKKIPKMRFREDKSIKEAANISEIVEELKKEREQRSAEE